MSWKLYRHPSDSTGPVPEETTLSDERTAQEAIAPSPDPVAQIKAELEEVSAESEQWRDRFLRKAAEFENYRKRTEKEKAESIIFANSSVLREFLPIADACERALESLQAADAGSEGIGQYREGVQLLYRQILDAMARFGVAPIDAVGKKFDPHFHEALAREENAEYDDNTVIRELRRGYLFKDRLLRPAQVTVSVRPHDGDEAGSAR